MNPNKVNQLARMLKEALILSKSDESIKVNKIDDSYWKSVAGEIISQIQQFDIDFREHRK